MNQPATTTRPRFFRCRAIYRGVALVLLNTLVVFVTLNAALWGWYRVRDSAKSSAPDPVSQRYGMDRLRRVYPQYSEDEIRGLLSESWSRRHQFEPFTLFKERTSQGRFVNVHEQGFRLNGSGAPWPPDKDHINIFVFGGSTTFGYGVADPETIPARLEAYLREKMESNPCVYNFGRSSYFSTQERILFEQLAIAGHVPDVAVFLDGLNEFNHPLGRPTGSNLLHNAVENPLPPQGEPGVIDWLPVTRFANGIHRRLHPAEATPRNPPTPQDPAEYNDLRLIGSIIGRYRTNIRFIEAIGRAQQTSLLFVWQPVPMYHYDDVRHHPFRDDGYRDDTRSAFGYAEMARDIAESPVNQPFLWLADLQQDLHEPLYIDKIHYAVNLSERIAKAIGDDLLQRGIVQKRTEELQ